MLAHHLSEILSQTIAQISLESSSTAFWRGNTTCCLGLAFFIAFKIAFYHCLRLQQTIREDRKKCKNNKHALYVRKHPYL